MSSGRLGGRTVVTGSEHLRLITLEVPEPVVGEALCLRLRARIEENEFAELVVCDLTRITRPDAAVIEALARVQLTALRLGVTVVYRHTSPEVRELLDLAGLSQVLALVDEAEG
jgi:anti-anti-sigma regulatory factor